MMAWKYRLGQRVEVRWQPTRLPESWRLARIEAQVAGYGYEVSFPDEKHYGMYPFRARDIREPQEGKG